MLGLRRPLVTIAEPAAEWPRLFQAEQQRIAAAVPGLRIQIEHVGSTAVPGLPAKPILDIGLLLERTEDLARLKAGLEGLGYIDRGDKGADGGHLFVLESAPSVRTHHLHVIAPGDPAWPNYLRFRDALRADAALRQRYAALKRTLAVQFPHDRAAYTKAKAAFIRDILAVT